MDTTVLQQSMDLAEKSFDSLSSWLMFFTAMVVVGLLLEYGEHFLTLFNKPFPWKSLNCVFFGGLLVTCGVAGELGVQFGLSKVETELRAKSKIIMDSLRASTAKATLETALARKETELVRQSIALANLRAAEAKSIADKEQLERVRLEMRLSPRRLAGEQKSSLIRLLSNARGSTVIVTSIMLDVESSYYADDFIDIFTKAGWNASVKRSHIANRQGVFIGKVGSQHLAGVEVVEAALRQNGINCKYTELSVEDHSLVNGFKPGIVYLLIERKSFGPAD